MIPDVNASSSNKNILNEFYGTNTFAKYEKLHVFFKECCRHEPLKNNN